MIQQQQNHCLRMDSGLSHWGLKCFYWYQIVALDSVVIKTQNCLARMETFLTIACIITEKLSIKINTLR